MFFDLIMVIRLFFWKKINIEKSKLYNDDDDDDDDNNNNNNNNKMQSH